MSATFTRAPWMAAAGPSSIVGWPIVSCGGGPGAGRSIASVSWMPGLPDELVEEIRANANLIAAAPELFEAAEEALILVTGARRRTRKGPTNAEAMLRLAIAKARGSQ